MQIFGDCSSDLFDWLMTLFNLVKNCWRRIASSARPILPYGSLNERLMAVEITPNIRSRHAALCLCGRLLETDGWRHMTPHLSRCYQRSHNNMQARGRTRKSRRHKSGRFYRSPSHCTLPTSLQGIFHFPLSLLCSPRRSDFHISQMFWVFFSFSLFSYVCDGRKFKVRCGVF